ncbi:hypothetical protein K449DRAFT_403303 [Hypoxylon sp. EC38]|nr:hypothetical protein K449DRAFT_403303 [Hypoxylon sp. EC38]
MPAKRGKTNKARRTTKNMKRCKENLLSRQCVDYTSQCIMCKIPLQCIVGRPLPCSPACREKLESCVSAAAGSSGQENAPQQSTHLGFAQGRVPIRPCLPAGFPLDPKILPAVVDSFPKISATTTPEELIGIGTYQRKREILLSWLCTSFEGTLVPTSESTQIKKMPGETQFMLVNTNLDRQRIFERNIKKNCPSGGSAAFHGTPTVHLLSILHSGLKESMDMDGSVWVAANPAKSLNYVTKFGEPWNTFKGWKNSAFRSHTVLFGVEVAAKAALFQKPRIFGYSSNCPTTICKQDLLMVRYIFLLPPQNLGRQRHYDPIINSMTLMPEEPVPNGDTVRPVMEEAFKRIHAREMTTYESVYYQELKSASEIIDNSRPKPSEDDDPGHPDDQPGMESEVSPRGGQGGERGF